MKHLVVPVHITTAYGREEVQLHTLLTLHPCKLCCRTISWPQFEVLTFLFLHKISLTNKWNRWLLHSWYPYLCRLQDFSITYPHSLALRPGAHWDAGGRNAGPTRSRRRSTRSTAWHSVRAHWEVVSCSLAIPILLNRHPTNEPNGCAAAI